MSGTLQINQLVKRYGGLLATDHVSLSLAAGELHAIIGPNGAGKTTLIGQLGGEVAPDTGSVIFDGADITALKPAQRALRGLARSYQITSVFPEFSVLENVALAMQAHCGHSFGFWKPMLSQPELVEPALLAIEQAGLTHRARTPVSELAHGERRQLELAMVLVAQPRLLLLDEPMAGMSHQESGKVVQLLQGLKGRYTMLLVEHDMDAVFALADRISVLVYGRIIASGTPEEIRANEEVRTAYLGDEVLPV
ncbi:MULTISPECIES: ABC transporter ATP-binding protein [unclassified Polaromonas]|uniref:ABC transporter ATP-binding protein n=1 Tax=unclassified Polaromonas TaxID=2638319 RepID=UPI000F076D09|nr:MULTISPECIES: ABC transporter ATP-binding protein [unclassified Polaromonas]AYQ26796.1 ABC transporter ATP-binding protein [Polaromonas sp. SP1]QGJ18358.1 ATP-binding cassette domain-containing protein [Polaromonas sp. Pch-P]